MTVDFQKLFPAVQPAVEWITQSSLIKLVTESHLTFALIEIGHLLFLAILGGSVLLLNLRILGLILKELPVQSIERAVQPWYRIGVAGALLTGIIMGLTTLRTLLPSEAFFIKMVALVAAIILSGIVAKHVRDGRTPNIRTNLAATAVGVSLWVSALYLFATTATVNSGSFLIALFGGALLVAATQRTQRVAVAGFSTVALAVWFTSLDNAWSPNPGEGIAGLTNGVMFAAVAPAVGFGLWNLRPTTITNESAQKLVAYISTLAWITVAAAGRWIGFS